jgi:hypothetical protein
VATGLPQGLPRPGEVGLDGTESWGRTYWGGALFWLLADIEIREATGNGRGVEHALRGILGTGGDMRVAWDLERALRTGDRATGTRVLQDLHARLGSRPVKVDLEALWRRLGVVRRGRSVRLDDRAPLASIRKSIVGAARHATAASTACGLRWPLRARSEAGGRRPAAAWCESPDVLPMVLTARREKGSILRLIDWPKGSPRISGHGA